MNTRRREWTGERGNGLAVWRPVPGVRTARPATRTSCDIAVTLTRTPAPLAAEDETSASAPPPSRPKRDIPTRDEPAAPSGRDVRNARASGPAWGIVPGPAAGPCGVWAARVRIRVGGRRRWG